MQCLLRSLFGDINFTEVDFLLDVFGVLAINGAADRDACSKDLLDGANEFSSVGLGAHLLGDFNNLVPGDLAVVSDVLHLLSIPTWLLEGPDDEGGGGVEHANLALFVADLHFDLDLDALPALGGLLDIFADLLGRHTDGRALGRESGSSRSFLTDDLHVDEVNRSGVESSFGRHSILFLPIY